MSDNFNWKELGGDFDQVNQNTGGAASAINNIAQKTNAPQRSFGPEGLAGYTQMPGVAPIAAGLAGVGSAVAGSAAVPLAAAYGIGKLVAPQQTDALVERLKQWVGSKVPGFINRAESAGSAYQIGLGESIPGSGLIKKVLPADWQDELHQITEQHKGMEMLGQGAGSAMQLGAPVAAPLKGITTLGKIGAATGNAALNMVPYAIGAGLNKYADTGDVGQALQTAGLNEAGGAVVGGAAGSIGGLISEKLPGLAKLFKRTATDTYLKEGLDIDPKAWKQAGTMGGKLKGMAAANHANFLRENFVQLGQEANITDAVSRQKWLDGYADRWAAVDAAGDAAIKEGRTVSSLTPEIMAHPDIQNFIQDNGQKGIDKVNELIAGASQKPNIAGVRHYLEKPINFVMKPGTPATIFDSDTAEAAGAIRDTFDSHFVPDDLKANYGKEKTLKLALEHKDLRLNTAGLTVGSQTAGRLIGSALAGGAMGAATGEGDPGKTLSRSIIGATLGGLGQAAGVKLANKGMGVLAGKLAPLIPELEARSGAPVANALASGIPRAIGMASNALNAPVESPGNEGNMPPQTQPTPAPVVPAQNAVLNTPAPATPQMEGTNWQTGPGTTQPVSPVPVPGLQEQNLPLPTPTPKAIESPKMALPEHQEIMNRIFNRQQDLTPDQAQNVDQALTPFKQHAVEVLKNAYDNWALPNKLPWDLVLKDAMRKTHNFDIMNPNTADILSPGDTERYMRTAETLQNFQTLPQDLSKVMTHSIYGGLGNVVDPQNQILLDRLVKSIYAAAGNEIKDVPPADAKKIKDKLIEWWHGGIRSRGAVLKQMGQEYNLDLPTMAAMQAGEK